MDKTVRKIIIGIFVFLLFLPSAQNEALSIKQGNLGLGKIQAFLFYSPHCGACLKLDKEYLRKIERKYAGKINIIRFNIDQEKNFALLSALARQYHSDGIYTPTMVVGNKMLVGVNAIEQNLEKLINNSLPADILLSQKLKNLKTKQEIMHKFKEISPATIIGAGLIDGINPCAFAVIVFFISFLSVYKYRRREVILIGLFYIAAVFFAYLFLGLGFFRFIYALKSFYIFRSAFYIAVAVFCLVLAAFSFYDYYQIKKYRKTKTVVLQLPLFLKKKINFIIGEGFRGNQKRSIFFLSLVSFFVGIGVSLLEAVCTGQIYIPTITFILKVPSLAGKAFVYLVIYNFMFIVPLLVIFALSIYGVSSKSFSAFLKEHTAALKFLSALLFLFLGLLLLLLK